MLVDKYEVMWLGSQKSVRWFCLDLIFLKKKKEEEVCVPFKLPNTFQSFFFFILPWHTSGPFLFDRVLP